MRSKVKYTTLLFVFLCSVISQGCSMPQRKAKVLQVGASGINAVTYPSDVRGAYFIKKESDVRICAEPAPDVALESLQKITADLTAKLSPTKDIGGKISSELSAKVIQLAGRTDLLLLARELLYRACEMSVNREIDNDAVVNLYHRVAKLVEDLGKSDRATAEADLVREKAALKKAGTFFDGLGKDK